MKKTANHEINKRQTLEYAQQANKKPKIDRKRTTTDLETQPAKIPKLTQKFNKSEFIRCIYCNVLFANSNFLRNHEEICDNKNSNNNDNYAPERCMHCLTITYSRAETINHNNICSEKPRSSRQ